jgi:chromosome partitioning protein
MARQEPLIIVLANGKGGVGKSTVAISLSVEWMQRGCRTLLVDSDPQGTAVTWGNVAADLGVATPTVIGMGDNVRQAVPELARDTADVCVVDTAGKLGKRLGGALMIADIAVLPCGPSPADIWALAETVETVQSIQELRPELKAYILINGADERTALTRDARANIGPAGLPIMQSQLCRRSAFAEVLAVGKGVTTYQPRSEAAAELRAVVDEIDKLIGRRAPIKTSRGKGKAATSAAGKKKELRA